MAPGHIIEELARNKEIFKNQLTYVSASRGAWRPNKGHWSLIEVVCHLHDEEREDFRTRVKHVLETPELALPPIDPVGWVKSRNYIGQDYQEMVERLLYQRQVSLDWLATLYDAPWDNTHQHPKFGPMSAHMFLTNWLVHDHIHIRQINRIHYLYVLEQSDVPTDYAGRWL